jgi:protein involved in polysaccharide export with SLBB domain
MHRYYLSGVLVLLLLGCSPVVTHPSQVKKIEWDSRDVTAPPYRIGAGDELEIKFFATPELNETVQVRPDGKISIMFAQGIKASGKTPEALAKLIKKKIAGHVKNPDILVNVHGFASQRVYVGGEVIKPGSFQIMGRETLMQALTEAGWLTPLARRDEVVLVRRDEDGMEEVYPFNLNKMLSGEDMSEDIIVQAGDLILVPPSDSVSFDRWVDRNIRQALPFSTSAGIVYTNQYQSGVTR